MKRQKMSSLIELKDQTIATKESQLQIALESKADEIRKIEEHFKRELTMRDELLLSQKENFQMQSKAQEDRFKNLSEEITRRRSQELSEYNSSNLRALIDPLKETIAKMELAFKENNQSDAERAGQLKAIMEQMMLKSVEVGMKADALAEALRSKPKLQGNWGEDQLRRLLDLENFVEGIDYETQVTMVGDEGNALRPDFIIHFPDSKDIVVDSKVSLTAFTRYIESQSDEERLAASKENLRSVLTHIRELAVKKYQRYVKEPRQALDYVIMFVPNEMALRLALEEQPNLWQMAIESRVFLASQQNLMVLLRLIRLAWTQDTQMRNYRELASHAERLIERTERLIPEMVTLRKKIEDVQEAYNKVDNRLRGKQGILTSARKISQLGGKANATLTAAIIDEIEE